MDDKNYDFLATQLEMTGFPESLREPLREKLQAGDAAFVLNYQAEIKKEQVNATLFFKKSAESEKYFFNSYRLLLTNEQHPNGLGQTFYITNKKMEEGQDKFKRDFTLKEGYNLLARADVPNEQRYVFGKWQKKDGELYNAWKGLDISETDKNGNFVFKNYHDSYGFKIEKSLASLPIRDKDKNDPELIRSLQKGNLVSVKNDANEIMYIAAYPPGRRINLFDKEMKLVNAPDQKAERKVTTRNANEMSQAQQVNDTETGYVAANKKKLNSVADTGDDIEGTSEKRGRRRRM